MMYSPGPCVMGVDVGIIKHIVVLEKISHKRYRLIYAGTRQTWNEIHDLAQKYNVKCAGIDIAPDIDAAKQFQKGEKYIVWLCDYKTSRNVSQWAYDEKNRVAKINRTEIMDTSHRMFIENEFILPRKEVLDIFIKQVCNPFKVESKNEKTGVPEYHYVGKEDHYRHALNYAIVAGKKAPIAKSGFYTNEDTRDCITEYSVI